MVESWMDRIARPSGAEQEEALGEPQSTLPARNRPAPAWDPYEVWLRQVKEVRDRAPQQYAPAVDERETDEPLSRSEPPRWRLRLSALLPRLSG